MIILYCYEQLDCSPFLRTNPHSQSIYTSNAFIPFFRSEESEVAMSGKVSPNTHTLPLSIVQSQMVFEMDEDEFEIVCGFPKPTPDETLVFSCAAGIRSKTACAYAAQGGYMKLVNYMGGAYEWFAPN